MQAEVQIHDESTTSGSRKRKISDKNKQDKDTIHAKKHMVRPLNGSYYLSNLSMRAEHWSFYVLL